MHWKLAALSNKTRQFAGPHGTCDLVLDERQEVKIGRAVVGPGSYALPGHWVQISSNHCRLLYKPEEGCWYVIDSSTNGTFINGVRAPRGQPRPLHPGDRLRLSSVPPNEPDNLFEYQLEQCAGGLEPAASGVPPPLQQAVQAAALAGAAAGQHVTPRPNKRKDASDVSESQPLTDKKARLDAHQQQHVAVAGTAAAAAAFHVAAAAVPGTAAGDGGAAAAAGAGQAGAAPHGGVQDLQTVIHLQKANQELRGRLEEERAGKEAVQAQLRAVHEAHAAALADERHKAVASRHEHRQHVEAELAASRSAQQAAEQAEQEAAQRAQQLEGELQQAQQGTAAAQAKLEAERAQREALETLLGEERRARAEADEGLAAAMLQVSTLQEELAQQQEALAGLLAQLRASEEAQAQAQEQVQELSANLEASRAHAGAAEARAAQLEASLAELQAARAGLEGGCRELEGQLAATRAQLGEARHQLDSLALREETLKENWLVVKACINQIQQGAAMSKHAKQKLDAFYQQVAVAKAEADTSYDAMMDQIHVVTEHLADAESNFLAGRAAPAATAGAAPTPLGTAAAGCGSQREQQLQCVEQQGEEGGDTQGGQVMMTLPEAGPTQEQEMGEGEEGEAAGEAAEGASRAGPRPRPRDSPASQPQPPQQQLLPPREEQTHPPGFDVVRRLEAALAQQQQVFGQAAQLPTQVLLSAGAGGLPGSLGTLPLAAALPATLAVPGLSAGGNGHLLPPTAAAEGAADSEDGELDGMEEDEADYDELHGEDGNGEVQGGAGGPAEEGGDAMEAESPAGQREVGVASEPAGPEAGQQQAVVRERLQLPQGGPQQAQQQEHERSQKGAGERAADGEGVAVGDETDVEEEEVRPSGAVVDEREGPAARGNGQLAGTPAAAAVAAADSPNAPGGRGVHGAATVPLDAFASDEEEEGEGEDKAGEVGPGHGSEAQQQREHQQEHQHEDDAENRQSLGNSVGGASGGALGTQEHSKGRSGSQLPSIPESAPLELDDAPAGYRSPPARPQHSVQDVGGWTPPDTE